MILSSAGSERVSAWLQVPPPPPPAVCGHNSHRAFAARVVAEVQNPLLFLEGYLHGTWPLCCLHPTTWLCALQEGSCTCGPAGVCIFRAYQSCSTIHLASVQYEPCLTCPSCHCRLRKDPLAEIDGGSKVRLAWQRVTNPRAAEAAAEKKKQAEAELKKAKEAKAKSSKKAGSWGGLPGRSG